MTTLKDVQDLETLANIKLQEKPQKVNENSGKANEIPLQKAKVKKTTKTEIPETVDAVVDEPPVELPKLDAVKPSKKTRSEKQMEVFNKAREKMLTNSKERKEKRALEKEAKQKEIEKRIVEKAIAIKKREIKRNAILEQISDDDSPLEEIKEIAKKIKPKPERQISTPPPPPPPPAPKSIFEKYRFI